MEEPQKKAREFPTKKDLYYWIIFLFCLVVAVFIWKFDDPKYLTDQLSLGATLFSIFLAVIAILITFIQSNESSRQSSEMTKEINTQTQEIVRLSTRYGDLLNKQSIVSEEVTDKVINKLSNSQGVPEEVLQDVKNLVNSAKIKQDQILFEKDLISSEMHSQIYITTKNEQAELLKYIRDAYAINVRMTVERLQEDLIGFMKKDIPLSALRSYIRNLSNSGFLEYEYDNAVMIFWKIK